MYQNTHNFNVTDREWRHDLQPAFSLSTKKVSLFRLLCRCTALLFSSPKVFGHPIILVIFYIVSQDGSSDSSATFSMLTIRDFLVAWIIQFTYSFSAAIVFSIRGVNTLHCWHRGRQRDLCTCCDLEQVNRGSCRLKWVLAWDWHYGGGSLWLRPLSFFGVGESL